MKTKRGTTLKSWETYPHKIKHKDKHTVTEKQYKKILKRFGEELAYELISTGDKIILPSKLGTMQVVKFKRKKKTID
jgi:hypothetical protein